MSEEKKPKFSGLTTKLGLQPMEAPQMVASGKKGLQIGLPKETAFQEHRISLTPEAVRILTQHDCKIVVQSGAGLDAHFTDNEYAEAGAEITDSVETVFGCEMVIKVAPPTIQELDYFKSGQVLISPIHLPTVSKEYVTKLMGKKMTAMAIEHVQDSFGGFPFVRSMSEIAGSSVVLIASELLNFFNSGKGLLLGGIAGVPPTKVIILGAGVVGTYAAKAALGLGAVVKVFDNDTYKLMRLQSNIGRAVFTSILSPEILEYELQSADVAIGAIHSHEGQSPIVVTEEMVSQMPSGSVVIDVSIDQGGCFETSEITDHDNPTYIKHDIIHYCVPNIPSRVPRTATVAISNNLLPILQRCVRMKGMTNLLYDDRGMRHGLYIFKGGLVNEHLADKFHLKKSNFEYLFAGDL